MLTSAIAQRVSFLMGDGDADRHDMTWAPYNIFSMPVAAIASGSVKCAPGTNADARRTSLLGNIYFLDYEAVSIF